MGISICETWSEEGIGLIALSSVSLDSKKIETDREFRVVLSRLRNYQQGAVLKQNIGCCCC
jgi:hypothetical protein